jgi:hypothetical protein
MTKKNAKKKLFAIFKKEIHKGNSYGIDKREAIVSYLIKAQFPISDEIIDEYFATEALKQIHYFKSKYIV